MRLVIPNTNAIETIDDPPRLNKGKGNPVLGINPITVEIFIIICIERRIINPVITYLSNSDEEIFKIWVNLIKNITHKSKRKNTPINPKL